MAGAISRRGFLRVGAVGSGLTLSGLLRSDAAAAAAGRPVHPERSVIILWMRGGPPHLDMWDMKPDAPAEYRGEFKPIPTNVPGIHLGDILPMSAKIMDKWSIIRSLHHHDAGHSTADQLCFTGYPHPVGADTEQNAYPSCGSILSRELGPKVPGMPAYVMIPRSLPGSGSAYLGLAHAHYETIADPATAPPGQFQVRDMSPIAGLDVNRLNDRRALSAQLDTLRREADAAGAMSGLDDFNRRAFDLLTSGAARRAFDIDSEPAKIRERYGFMPEFKARNTMECGCPAWSQRVLLARRLIEAGVRIVTVDLRWWDTHIDNFYRIKAGFAPRFDQAFTALITDLHERGILESTMVIAWGEFGRTPRINKDAGRDHWPNVFSAALAGGPIRGGRVAGSSDARGEYPKDNPKHPTDVLATMYDWLGVNVAKEYVNNFGRPLRILYNGDVIRELV
jgi:hypothetical protein